MRLRAKGLILDGTAESVARELNGVRFHNNKARYITLARHLFMKGERTGIRRRLEGFEDPFERREWIAQTVKGLGYKEASHFLRNIGLGERFAILDRHILRRLLKLGVMDRLPTCVSRKCYLDTERKMSQFASAARIPMDHLDLLLWFLETGIVFR
jgi:N-glycosylase/DNA lyase